jgi:hypothetical protein
MQESAVGARRKTSEVKQNDSQKQDLLMKGHPASGAG